MANKTEPTITFDGKTYNIADLSDNGKAQLAFLQFTEKQLKKLKGELSVAQTARAAYIAALKAELAK